MTRNPLITLIAAIAIVFVAVMAFFYIRYGSMEAAGAEMDTVLSDAADVTERAADNLGEATEDFVDDVRDGTQDGQS
ncbi:hypothetical protein [Ponticaulis sp.]|uniref:hypothetical protein n=1 Tax=Ponticaulis sp. TaxID=2020902 RepID=UPI000B6C1F41|nr:hypothetical protein [Ponticaulis sp.]MAI88984.1 hypothetical protein [Ponticaulis sp.]OUY01669.1 MAG: hypothetical protein CBB65_00695 [Hyphomonadaceae bacterium TMED5]|tara:strand:+ start:99569 stop:99799 length:231 start_codon:yes stop_codon:yes gene_type:complete